MTIFYGRKAGCGFETISVEESQKATTMPPFITANISLFAKAAQVPVQKYYSHSLTNLSFYCKPFAIDGHKIYTPTKMFRKKHDRKELNIHIKHTKKNWEANWEAMNRCKKSYLHPRMFPGLAGIYFHESGRQVRSEFRENEIAVLKNIFNLVNLNHMKLGWIHPHTGYFIPYTLEQVCKQAGLKKSVMDDISKKFKDEGIWTIHVTDIYDEDTKKFKRIGSCIEIHQKIYDILDLTQLFLENRKKAQEIYEKKEIKYQANRLALEKSRPSTPILREYKKNHHTGFLQKIMISTIPSYKNGNYKSSSFRSSCAKKTVKEALSLFEKFPNTPISEHHKTLIEREMKLSRERNYNSS